MGKTWWEDDRQSATARLRGSGCFFACCRGLWLPPSTRPPPPPRPRPSRRLDPTPMFDKGVALSARTLARPLIDLSRLSEVSCSVNDISANCSETLKSLLKRSPPVTSLSFSSNRRPHSPRNRPQQSAHSPISQGFSETSTRPYALTYNPYSEKALSIHNI